MKIARVLLLAAVVCVLVAPAALAAGETNNFRFHLGYFSATGDYKVSGSVADVFGSSHDVSGDLTAKYQSSLGVGVGYEYKFDDMIGLDFGLKYFKPDVKLSFAGAVDGTAVSGQVKGSSSFMPFTVGAMFHVAKTDSIDFFLGPELAYVMWGDVKANSVEALVGGIERSRDISGDFKAKMKSELTYGVKFGIDVPFNPNWAFNANLEYLGAKAKVDTSDSGLSVNLNAKPLLLTAGATYKF